jgi:hypothetical protein
MNQKLFFPVVRPGLYIALAAFSLASADDRIPVGFKTNRYSHLWERDPFTLVAQAMPQATVSVDLERAGARQTVAEATVSVVRPEKSGTASLQLPGQLWAYTDAPIYAQTSGYLTSWAFDIGAKVKANDILGAAGENRDGGRSDSAPISEPNFSSARDQHGRSSSSNLPLASDRTTNPK